jgi:hypothetical protein
MSYKVRLPLYVTFALLKSLLGWPYGRAQTSRLERERKYHRGDPFPARVKVGGGTVRCVHVVWPTHEVLDWMRRRGMRVPENIEFFMEA